MAYSLQYTPAPGTFRIFPVILALKLTLTPLLIALASLVQRRWGGLVAGLLAGLPLTSAPVSVFLALEHGPAFAAQAATGTLLGVIAMSAFCAGYARTSRRHPWTVSAVSGLVACGVTTIAVSWLPTTLPLAAFVSYPALLLLVCVIGRPPRHAPAVKPPGWDIPARMVVATISVMTITAVAHLIGPKWTGLLSPLPVFAFVMAVFSQRLSGAGAAQRLLRGIAVGTLGAATFFLTVALLLERSGLVACYAMAVFGSLATVAVSQWLLSAPSLRISP